MIFIQMGLRPSYEVGVVLVEAGESGSGQCRYGDESVMHRPSAQTEPRKSVFVSRATEWCPSQDELQQVPVERIHHEPFRGAAVLISSCRHFVVRWLGPTR